MIAADDRIGKLINAGLDKLGKAVDSAFKIVGFLLEAVKNGAATLSNFAQRTIEGVTGTDIGSENALPRFQATKDAADKLISPYQQTEFVKNVAQGYEDMFGVKARNKMKLELIDIVNKSNMERFKALKEYEYAIKRKNRK
jgi:hypothetical protein